MHDVVIIGGGAAGCATAYYLAREGARVAVVERAGIASHASGYAAGGLFPLQGYEVPGLLGEFAMLAFNMHREMWDGLRSESDIDFEPRTPPRLHLAFADSEIPALETIARLFEQADGFSARWLDAHQVRTIEPRVAPDVVRGVELRGSAAVDSKKFTTALLRAAEKHGATLIEGSVTALKTKGGKVAAVTIGGKDVAAEKLVIASGPWTSEAARWLNVDLPVEPLKGELLRMQVPGGPFTHSITHVGGDMYGKSDGLVWLGTTEERRGLDLQPTDSAKQGILSRNARAVPALRDARLVMHTACLRPVTPDWLPILGRLPGWDNAYACTGAGKKGILFAPAMGRAVADIVLRGETTLPVANFTPDRFAR
ncbi:MAG: FAD-dependent oxidoreductase [SAR202 cluster bacterium]|nr:FAD-dependent oxidoreductase [SAR202 cluster bacterium]